jgi:hypothetical protein
VPEGGCAFVYVLDEPRQADIIATLKKRLAAIEGVNDVLEPVEFAKLGLPLPDANPEAPHLVLTTGPGYSFADPVVGEAVVSAGGLKGSHGHIPSPDYMHATFIAAGAGIKPGTKLEIIRNVDVAPTIARLLGIEMKDVDGKVLTEILSQ